MIFLVENQYNRIQVVNEGWNGNVIKVNALPNSILFKSNFLQNLVL